MRKHLLVLPLLLLAACGPSVGDVAETRAAEIKPVLEQIDKAGTAAKENNEAATAFAVPDGEKLAFQSGADKGNAMLIQTEDFDKVGVNDGSYLDLVITTDWLDGLKRVYSGDIDEYETPDNFNWNCDKAARMKYMVVVRAKAFQPAKIVDESSYEPGAWLADLLLFELSSCKCLGVLEVSATNSDDIYADYNTPTAELESDLMENARDAIRAALKPYTDTNVFN